MPSTHALDTRTRFLAREDGFVNMTQLNGHPANGGKDPVTPPRFLMRQLTKEVRTALNEYLDRASYVVGRGRGATSWAHPLLAILYLLHMEDKKAAIAEVDRLVRHYAAVVDGDNFAFDQSDTSPAATAARLQETVGTVRERLAPQEAIIDPSPAHAAGGLQAAKDDAVEQFKAHIEVKDHAADATIEAQDLRGQKPAVAGPQPTIEPTPPTSDPTSDPTSAIEDDDPFLEVGDFDLGAPEEPAEAPLPVSLPERLRAILAKRLRKHLPSATPVDRAAETLAGNIEVILKKVSPDDDTTRTVTEHIVLLLERDTKSHPRDVVKKALENFIMTQRENAAASPTTAA